MVALALTLLLLAGCGLTGAPAANPADPVATLEQAVDLLKRAPDEIWLYQDELAVDTTVEPYRSPQGLLYYPVTQFKTLAELQAHSRLIFTQDFCDNVLNAWSLKPEKPRFIELNGQLWECKAVSGLGWVQSLLTETAQLVVLDAPAGAAVVDAFSQSLLGDFTVERFWLVLEDDHWKLDSYYKFNRQQERPKSPSVVSYMQTLSGSDQAPLEGITVLDSQGNRYREEDQIFTGPFHAALTAVEYLPGSEKAVKQAPELPDNVVFVQTVGGQDQTLTFAQDGYLYLQPEGSPVVYQLQLVMPTATTMMRRLVEALRWNQKIF